jgi:endonuclease YncB( thermonuclease family)
MIAPGNEDRAGAPGEFKDDARGRRRGRLPSLLLVCAALLSACRAPEVPETPEKAPVREAPAAERPGKTPVRRGDLIAGRVVSVQDGDTLTVADARSGEGVRVRLATIDAPERGQAFSNKSRGSLSQMASGRDARVEVVDRDRYGRAVGIVTVDGTDLGLEQIRRGFAWHYEAYARQQTDEGRKSYAAAQAAARSARQGLWTDRNPVPPWEHRKK